MSRVNTVVDRQPNRTHEGAPAYAVGPEQELRRSVMACLLWEDEFYESGKTIADRIAALVPQVAPAVVAATAVEARSRMHLRHVPLLLVREMARATKEHRLLVADTLEQIIQRPDELAEFLAIYWSPVGTGKRIGRQPLSAQVKKGLARAFVKFDAYQLSKYDRDGAVKLRDVLFLSHAKPSVDADGAAREKTPTLDRKGYKRGSVWRHTSNQGGDWARLIAGTLPAPDTWEVAISAAPKAEKPAVWRRLLTERKLGAMALLRNLRNLQAAHVPDAEIAAALRDMNPERVLPFRFLAALRYAPQFVSELDAALLKNLASETRKLSGTTIVLVDVSGSMTDALSAKSDMQRMDAAAGLAVLARELCERARVYTFSERVVEVPAFRGLALAKAINESQAHSGTQLGAAVRQLNVAAHERLIVITDEQSHDRVPAPARLGYMINVASAKHGVGYGPWTHVDGWSDRVLDYVCELEQA